jgi:ubiquinone biosynthesis protein Coq4
MLPFPGIETTQRVLGRPDAPELVASAIERGLQCHGDIAVDHGDMLDRPLAQVRAELGIPDPIPGRHMFIL